MSKALVILSGGQDSTTCLFWAKQNYDEVMALSFYYGQKHYIELESAKRIAAAANIKHAIIEIDDSVLVSSSPLLSDSELEQYQNYNNMVEQVGNRVEKTFVPMRNLFFLVVAANHALSYDCSVLVTGVSEADGTNYPDCTSDFIRVAEAAINVSLMGFNESEKRRDLVIKTPLIDLSKGDIVRLAYSMPACWEAMAYTHTSYAGEYPPTDSNHANILRAKGFEDAGLPDPLVMRAFREGLMELPNTLNYKNLQFELNFKD